MNPTSDVSSVSSWSRSFQFEDSEDDFDRFDTDDELSYRRDSVYSCVTLPYFHSFLYIKGISFIPASLLHPPPPPE